MISVKINQKMQCILTEIHDLAHTDGFIYTVCAFSLDMLNNHSKNTEILNTAEIYFLLGYLVKSPLNLSIPTEEKFIDMLSKTKDLMEKLHNYYLTKCGEAHISSKNNGLVRKKVDEVIIPLYNEIPIS